ARAFERLPEYEYADVFRAIRPSILELKRSAPRSLSRLMELAAFHWEEGVPESAVTQFWIARGCPTADDAEQVLIDLASRSLVRLDGEAPRRRARVHDLQLDYLIA